MDAMKELSRAERIALVNRKILLWRNSWYDAKLDAEVADALEDNALKERAKNAMKSSLKAIKIMSARLSVLKGKNNGATSQEIVGAGIENAISDALAQEEKE